MVGEGHQLQLWVVSLGSDCIFGTLSVAEVVVVFVAEPGLLLAFLEELLPPLVDLVDSASTDLLANSHISHLHFAQHPLLQLLLVLHPETGGFMLRSNCLGHLPLVRLKIDNSIALSGSPHAGIQG